MVTLYQIYIHHWRLSKYEHHHSSTSLWFLL